MGTEPIEIEKLDISVRLKNALRRSGFTDLRDISSISRESILRIRNMGMSSYNELQKQCDKYGIVIHSKDELKDQSKGISWSDSQCSELFRMGIKCIDDIRTYPMSEVEKTKYSKPEIYGRLKEAKRKLNNELQKEKISSSGRSDAFQLNLDGTKIEFRIKNYRPSTEDEYYEEWCLITVRIKGNSIDYSVNSECMTCSEVEELNEELDNLIMGAFNEDKEITFIEPDFEFRLFPNKKGNYYIEWKFNLWYKGALTANYFVLMFADDDIRQFKTYLEEVIEEGSHSK